MSQILKKLIKHEGFMYIIVGIMTTVVNFVVFHVLDTGLSAGGIHPLISYKIAYAAAFIAAVVFAYWTNKFWVFRNYCMKPGYLFREFCGFVSARIVSGIITFIGMVVLVEWFGLGHMLSLMITTVFNLVFNYVASKFWIFRK